MDYFKLFMMGDSGVGKTCLLFSYTMDVFPREYVPTVFDNYSTYVRVNRKSCYLELWESGGQSHDRMGPLIYPQTDIFLVCFSVENRVSFENIKDKWAQELQRFMPDVPRLLVGCKSDLRWSGRSALVTAKEAQDMAKELGWFYYETSALKQSGVSDLFKVAVEIARGHCNKMKLKKKSAGLSLFRKQPKKDLPQAPIMPPAGKAPWLEVETAQIANHWMTLLQSGQHSDVTFVLAEGQQRLEGHKLLLAAASTFFATLFEMTSSNLTQKMKIISGIRMLTKDDVNAGRVEGLSAIYESEVEEEGMSGKTRTTVEIRSDITAATFLHVLEFLYSGLPQISDETTEEELRELSRVADIFRLPQLRTICQNQEREEEFLNPSIGTFLNKKTAAKLKDLALNQSQHADIVFHVQGTKIYAHKFILCARCEVLAAMFSGSFMEANFKDITEVKMSLNPEVFLAFLEYLYTDHSPIEKVDGLELLMLADQYNQNRLMNLCELSITKIVDRACKKRIERANIDVIGLHNMAEMHNAKQLSNWCRHFISTNYDAFSRRTEFSALTGEAREYVEEHQWPPLDYLEAVARYEKAMKSLDS